MENRKIYVYGLTNDYRLVAYRYIVEDKKSIREINAAAVKLKLMNPDIEWLFAVDEGRDLYRAYKDLRRVDSVENRVLFKIFLETEGLRLDV